MISRWVSANVGVLITAFVLAGSGIAGYTRLENRVDNIDSYRAERSRFVDTKFAALDITAGTVPTLVLRVTSTEEGLKATNARVDQSLSNISARLAEINQAIGSLSTQVAVLTQRLEQVAPDRRADAGKIAPR